jgi:membrane protein
VFYSAQILFGGAEFAQVYARNSGSHFRPSKNAVAVKQSTIDSAEQQRSERQPLASARSDSPA